MVLIAVSTLTFGIWLALAATRLPVARRAPRLADAPPPPTWPGVVTIIPARNEEATIGAVIAAHTAGDYAGANLIILVDDQSSDATAARAMAAAGELTLVAAAPLPAGWTGKLWAVKAGLARAADIAPTAKYVLLADADIALAPQTLSRLVAQAERSGAALTSLMARLDARGFWGGLLIPAFVFFFYKLYPFHVVNDPSSRLAAAAGGCMLVRRDALEAISGVDNIRGKLIDDCALASAIKSTGRPIWIGLATHEAVSLRDNRSLSSIWSMVARTAFAQLHHSWLLLAGTATGMVLIYLAAPAIALSYPLHLNAGAALIGAAAWALMAISHLSIARAYDQTPWKTLFLPVAAFFYTLMTIASAVNHARGAGGAWKGRLYPA